MSGPGDERGRCALGVVLVALVVANLLANRIVPEAHVAVAIALMAVLAAVARASGLSAADLGLARATWPAGARWGVTVGALIGTVFALAYLFPPVRSAVAEPGPSWADVLASGLLVVPLVTVVPEELAFRGVLWALLLRRHGSRVATEVSSALFGLWHVLPALRGGPANEAVIDVVGAGTGGTVVRVVGTVLVTAAAGLVLCLLRQRSGSLLAPILMHWAINGLGVLFVRIA